MIVTLITWIYIFIICFSCGLLVRKALGKFFGYDIKAADSVVVSGIIFTAVFAQIWSIFTGVSLVANVVLVLLSLVSIVLNREKLREYYLFALSDKGFLIRIILFAVVFAAISSDVPMDYDTYLYHGQSIAWIERYGLVKGLANLHNRFGYNSAFMCLQALFSFGFAGRSLHQLNGFICLFMALFITENRFLKNLFKDPGTESILALSAWVYMALMVKSISSPGSDMMTMLLLIYVFIKWADLIHKGVRNGAVYGYLAMSGLFLSTLKLSAAPVFLLAVYPVYLLIKEKRAADIIRFMGMGILIFMPFIIRNVLITGYLLYPMEKLDIFNFDWKVPAHVALIDRTDITDFGRAIHGMEGSFSLTGWIQVWFRNLEFLPRLIFCVSVCCMGLFVYMLFRFVTKRDIYEKKELFTAAVAALTFIYWFLGSPNMRYGIAIVLIFCAVIFGAYVNTEGKKAYLFFLSACTLIILFSCSGDYMKKNINLIFPEDYSSFECREVTLEKDGAQVTIYTPVEGDQSGTDVFPATPEINPDYTELRGTDIRDGFRAIKH